MVTATGLTFCGDFLDLGFGGDFALAFGLALTFGRDLALAFGGDYGLGFAFGGDLAFGFGLAAGLTFGFSFFTAVLIFGGDAFLGVGLGLAAIFLGFGASLGLATTF